jgi:hypothetical protein
MRRILPVILTECQGLGGYTCLTGGFGMKHMIFGLLALLLAANASQAQDMSAQMRAYVAENVAAWAHDPVIVDAIKAQNLRTAGYDQARIDELDTLWMAQVGMSGVPLIDDVLQNPAADFLRARMAASQGTLTEAFIMDAKGLNVAAAAATSDYWQGDEAKFTETYPNGAGAMHFSDVALDASSGQVQAQVSMAITDPDSGQVIGAMTLGINLNALM